MKNSHNPTKFFVLGIFSTMVFVAMAIVILRSHRRLVGQGLGGWGIFHSVETELSKLRVSLTSKTLRMRRSARETKLHRVSKRNAQMEVEPGLTGQIATSYIRWGRMDCPEDSMTVYHGFAAGSYFGHTGSGANYICIHHNVSYPDGRYVEGGQAGSHIYGVEWRDSTWTNTLFDYSDIQRGSMHLQSLSCAVCIARQKVTNIMIPGRETCPPGWAVEYAGYIMSGRHDDKHSSEYICVDQKPMPVLGTESEQHGAYIGVVEAHCGHSLPCEPIVEARELRCVVCSI